MQLVRLVILIVLLALFSGHANSADKDSIRVALLATGEKQMATYGRLFSQFEAASNVKVQLDFYSDITFKKHIQDWIELGGYDLLYWQAGNRLEKLVKAQTIVPIDSLIDGDLLKRQLQSTGVDSVTFHDSIYALPIGQYIWGFYYNKEIFAQLNLSPPTNWREFTLLIKTLQDNDITPLIQASFDGWPVLAWLDYFAADTGGEGFRNALTQGQFGTKQQQVALLALFEYLVSNNLFFAPQHTWRWDQAVPALLRKQAAMTLLAQFVEDQTQRLGDDKIGFFPFPYQKQVPNPIEVAPMEVFVVPTSTNKRSEVAAFLDFIIKYSAIDSLAYELGWLSVSNQPSQSLTLSERTLAANKRTSNAGKLLQYFDREAPFTVTKAWTDSINTSFRSGSVEPLRQLMRGNIGKKDPQESNVGDDERLLNFSTLRGLKGSFLASKLLDLVYTPMGYDISVTRYPDIKSIDYGADGLLVSVVEKPDGTSIRLAEPLAETGIYLVGSQNSNCDHKPGILNESHKVSVVADAIRLNYWASKLGSNQIMQRTPEDSWSALHRGEIDYVLAFEPDVYSRRHHLKENCFVQLESITAHHFLSSKHAKMAKEVNLRIIEAKKTDIYKQYLREYGLGILPRKKS